MSWWTTIFGEPADWRLCTQIDADYVSRLQPGHPRYNFNVATENETAYTYTYYLYEDQDGNRRFEVIDTQDGDLNMEKEPKNSFVYRNREFRNKIRPWLDGRVDPDIPSYEQVPVDDFKVVLKGSKK